MTNTSSIKKFVAAVLPVFLPTGRQLEKHFYDHLFDDRMLSKLPRYFTAEDVYQHLKTDNDWNDIYTKLTTLFLNDWERLSADSKLVVLAAASKYELEQIFVNAELDVSIEDEQFNSIPWHIAHVVFNEEKDKRTKKLEKLGLRSVKPFITAGDDGEFHRNEMIDEVSKLIECCAKVYMGAVTTANVPKTKSIIQRIRGHTFDQYVHYLDHLRFALRYSSVFNHNGQTIGFFSESEFDALPVPLQKQIDEHINNEILGAFIRQIEDFMKSISETKPSVSILEKINHLTREYTMTKITISGDGNVIGSNNKVITTVNKSIGLISPELASEVALLKAEIEELTSLEQSQRNRALSAIESAETEIEQGQEGDNEETENRLNRFINVMKSAGKSIDEGGKWVDRFKKVITLLRKVTTYTFPLLP